MDGMRVAVVFLTRDIVHADFMMCCMNLMLYRPKIDCMVQIAKVTTSSLPRGRNEAVDLARRQKADYILFLDTDMIFPYDTLERLLSWKKDIVGACYVNREPPHGLMGVKVKGGIKYEGLTEMEKIPTGVMLVKMSVFDAFKKPIFRDDANEETGDLGTEDYYFCKKAREKGFRVWMDNKLTFEVKHLGLKAYGTSDSMPVQ